MADTMDGNERSDEERHGLLSSLFLSLVNTESDPTAQEAANPQDQDAGSATDKDASQAAGMAPTSLDLQSLSQRLGSSKDPMAYLRNRVRDIQSREVALTATGTASAVRPPSGFERYLARRLDEAGLLATDVSLPTVQVIRPQTSDLFYLRIPDQTIPYLAKQRVIAIEAALNAALLADAYLADANVATEEELTRLEQRIMRSVTAQVPTIDDGEPTRGESRPDGEWAVRRAIATAIEDFQLPYRLGANFRVNMAAGNVAFELSLISPDLLPRTAYVDALGLVSASESMRRRATTEYNLRVGILLAALAFRCSPQVQRVCVAGVSDTASKHACYFSAELTRQQLGSLDLMRVEDPLGFYEHVGAAIDQTGGTMAPVRQTFRFEEERFCPHSRYDEVETSARELPDDLAHALGARRVCHLGIDEAAHREAVATEVARHLTDSTTQNVRTILSLAGDDADPTVHEAASRTARALIDGSIADDDVTAVEEEFAHGDALSKAVHAAGERFEAKDPAGAIQLLTAELEPLEVAGTYADDEACEWRSFGSYVDRVIYNRLLASCDKDVRLVPNAYLEGLLTLSVAQLLSEDAASALAHARRAVEVAPLSVQCRFHLAHCLETLGRPDDAREELCRALRFAHDPQSVGFCYYRMAFFEWQAQHFDVASACYQRALHFLPASVQLVGTELQMLAIQVPGIFSSDMPDATIQELLLQEGIPVAPTQEVTDVFFDGVKASMDANVFPVARAFMSELCRATRSDIYFGLARSLEDAPDE